MDSIKRDHYLKELIDRKGNGMIKVITGIRRCGKSYLLSHIYQDYLLSHGVPKQNILPISLEDDESEELRDPKALSKFIREKLSQNDAMHYVFIDEVQYAIKKEDLKSGAPLPLYSALNGLMKLPNADIYVTGSNSKLLSKDVMTEFRGRGDEVRLFPLTFREFYDYIGGDKDEAFGEYALYGGLPFVRSRKNPQDKTKYLTDLFREVYFRDIEERYRLSMPEVLEMMTDDLCSSIGSLTNSLKIAKTLKSVRGVDVNSQTIATYLRYLEDSFLFHEAKRYDVKGKKYFSYPSKFYCTDLGLRNARLNFRQQEETHAMENIIYNELLARGYSVDVGVVDGVSKGMDDKPRQNQYEIDFVVNRGMNKCYIQSAWNIDDPEKEKAELRPLMFAGDFFKRILVTRSRMKPWFDEIGILHVGLYDFLLDESLLG